MHSSEHAPKLRQHLVMVRCFWRSSLKDLGISKFRSSVIAMAMSYTSMNVTARYSVDTRRHVPDFNLQTLASAGF